MSERLGIVYLFVVLGRAWASDFVLFCLGVETDEITYCLRRGFVIMEFCIVVQLWDRGFPPAVFVKNETTKLPDAVSEY